MGSSFPPAPPNEHAIDPVGVVDYGRVRRLVEGRMNGLERTAQATIREFLVLQSNTAQTNTHRAP